MLDKWEPQDLPKIIAIANDDLPDGSPHKSTWAHMDQLRGLQLALKYTLSGHLASKEIGEVADILESLLAPRTHRWVKIDDRA